MIDRFCTGVDSAHRAADSPAFLFEPFSPQTLGEMVANLPFTSDYSPLPHPDSLVDEKPTRFALPIHAASTLSRFWLDVGEALRSDSVRYAIAAELRLQPSLMHPAVALIRDLPGYQIRPHPDSKHKLATAQVYLPNHARARHIGTRFYRKYGDAFTETAAVPYLPGQGYFFRRTDDSWHGVEPTTEADGVRDSLMLIYFDSPKVGFT